MPPVRRIEAVFARLGGALSICACLLTAACATTIVPPETIVQPAGAAVLDHGRHSSLVIEVDGTPVRYAWGEWDWYAEGRTGIARAFGALFWPSPATLGRRRLAGPFTAEAIARQVREGIEEILVFEVEASRARQLARRLDGVFESAETAPLYQPAYDLEFVILPDPYWLGRNSNLVTGEWLEELGCRVEGEPILSRWRLEAPP